MGAVRSKWCAWLGCAWLAACSAGCSPELLAWIWSHPSTWPDTEDASVTPSPCPVGAVLSGEDCAWTYSQLAAAGPQTCGVRTETGEVVCWGQGLQSPPRDIAFSQIALGHGLKCGLRRDTGSIVCWGGVAPSGLPAAGSFTHVSVNDGDDFSSDSPLVCAIHAHDGQVECWGSDLSAQVSSVPRDVAFREVSVGNHVSCGIRRDDSSVMCWGAAAASIDSPGGELCSLAGASFGFAMCGVTCAGQAVCWGSGGVAAEPPSDKLFRQISQGLFMGCGIRAADGGIECWGGGASVPSGVAYDQLAVGGAWSAVNTDTSDDYAGFPEHVCALRADDHRVECWGSDVAGQVGGAPSLTRYRALTASEWITTGRGDSQSTFCALRERDGLAQCWGGPSRLSGDVAYSSVATGCGLRAQDSRADCGPDGLAPLRELDSFVGRCGLRLSDSEALCWRAHDNAVVEVAPGVALRGLTVGQAHACAIRTADDHALCWGSDIAVAQTPADVRFQSVQARHFGLLDATTETCGIRMEDKLVQCWGETIPGLRSPPNDVRLDRLSSSLLCGILADTHEIACWRDGKAEVEPSQRGVAFREIASSSHAICGIRELDGLWTCWGGVQWNPL